MRPFTGAVFIATSLDGYIARSDGDIDWLTAHGEGAGDTGYSAFLADIDHMVMGRRTYEKALTFGSWPYPDRPVAVLSSQLAAGEDPRIHIHRSTEEMVEALVADDARRVYLDGGQVVQRLLALGLVHEMTITTVPVLLGDGIRLFGRLEQDLPLLHRTTTVLGAGLVQSTYTVGE